MKPLGLVVVASVPLTAEVAPSTVTAPPFDGEAETVWRAPLVMMDGEIGSAAIVPELSEVVAVTTNCCKRPVSCFESGLTLVHPAIVKMSPLLSVVAPEAQPLILTVDPV